MMILKLFKCDERIVELAIADKLDAFFIAGSLAASGQRRILP